MVQKEKMTLVTEDHSLVNELVETWWNFKGSAEYHPKKNVVIKKHSEPKKKFGLDVKTVVIEEDIHYLLCSEGYQKKFLLMICRQILTVKWTSLKVKGSVSFKWQMIRVGKNNITLVPYWLCGSTNESRWSATCWWKTLKMTVISCWKWLVVAEWPHVYLAHEWYTWPQM